MPAIVYPALEHALIQDSIVIAASLLILLTKILPCALSTQQPLYDQPVGRPDTEGEVEDTVEETEVLVELVVTFAAMEVVVV